MDPLTLASLAGGAGSLIQGGFGFLGGQNQAKATQQASQNQLMLGVAALQQQAAINAQNQANIKPFMDLGAGAGAQLGAALPRLTQAFDPSQANLEQTPGYQWNLQQTLKAGQNSAAARGLGVSGAAIKGAERYATGLASQTQDQQAGLFFNNQNNAYNKLFGVTGLGANAASGLATNLQNNANAQTNLLTGIGNTQAAGVTGQAAGQNQGLGAIGQAFQGSLPMLAYAGGMYGKDTGTFPGWTPEMLASLQG